MKKSILLFAVAVVGMLTSCISVQEVKSDRPVKSEKRQTAPFERIRLTGSPTIYYAQADSMAVRVVAPEDVLAYVVTDVEDSCLTVRIDDRSVSSLRKLRFMDGDQVEIHVTSPDLVSVQLVGSGDFNCDGHLDTDRLRIELKGSGDMHFADIICDHLSTSVVGSGDVSIDKVVAATSALELVGSGDLRVTHQGVAHTDIMLKGSGDVESTFLGCGDVVSELRGSGDITLSGKVRSLKNHVVGSGECDVSQLFVKSSATR